MSGPLIIKNNGIPAGVEEQDGAKEGEVSASMCSRSGGLIGMMGMGARSHGAQAAADPVLAVWIARLVFIVPLLAVLMIVQNLRGVIGKALQLGADLLKRQTGKRVPDRFSLNC